MNVKQQRIHRMASRYLRVIEWSDDDGCYIGSAPPLIGHSCHGASAAEVARQLDEIVLDVCEDIVDGKVPAPKDGARKRYSGKFLVRLSPALHKKAALKAMAREISLNEFVADAIAQA